VTALKKTYRSRFAVFTIVVSSCTGGSAEPAPDGGVAVADSGSSDGSSDTSGSSDGISDVVTITPDAVLANTDGLAGPGAGRGLLDEWPIITPGAESRLFSSFDRTGGNNDGFLGTYSTLYLLPSGEHVIMDAFGPGRLNTLWFTSGESGFGRLALGRIRIYVDDEQKPRVEAEANELFSGQTPGFPGDLVFNNTRSTGGYVSWVRIPFASRLVITTEQEPFFYSAQYDSLPEDVRSWSPGDRDTRWSDIFASASVRWDEETADGRLTGLVGIPLVHSQAGSGVIDAIVFQPLGQSDLHGARIRITWDDEDVPGVDTPLGMFFGSGLGEASVKSVALRMSPGLYQNRFPMPFWKGFRLEITGIMGTLRIRVNAQRFDPSTAGHLRAVFNDVPLTTQPADFEYVSFVGAGKLVGTVLTVEPPNPSTDKRWWEGDLRSYADGRRTPGLHGTGHEDDFLGGWSNEFFDGPFSLPLHGEPATQIFDRNGQFNGNVTLYRLWPGIPFLNQVTHSVEHGAGNTSAVHYSAVTFLYAQPRSWLSQTDKLTICDDQARQSHSYSVNGEGARLAINSTFEGRGAAVVIPGCYATHTGPASFSMAVDSANEGILLRRMFDQSNGPQRAAVSVDGRAVGTWYIAETNKSARWAERDFFLPSRVTSGKARLTVLVEPIGTGPSWGAAEYRTLSVVPARGRGLGATDRSDGGTE
jgi:Protein of unknown function (DUF2961)